MSVSIADATRQWTAGSARNVRACGSISRSAVTIEVAWYRSLSRHSATRSASRTASTCRWSRRADARPAAAECHRSGSASSARSAKHVEVME